MLLLDNSAYARLSDPRLLSRRQHEIQELFQRDEIAVCLPFVLEAGFSARNAALHEQLMRRMQRFIDLPITSAVGAAAKWAQSELARVGHHRLAPIDLIIAAVAHEHGAGVLHYDADYDVIAEKTSLEFESVWLAEPGTL